MRIFSLQGILFLGFFGLFTSCHQEPATLFTRLSSNDTGIDFENILQEDDPTSSIMTYPYFYNGGGVAIGDINNDGLPDIFFTGNMVSNRIFLNKGEFKFDDITTKAGIGEKKGWCTGVTMVDINEDGWLDIYVCRSGLAAVGDRSNLLFINNHDLSFTESAIKYGLDDKGYSTQSSFFDYDKDGDLDMFLINQSTPEFARGFLDYVQTKAQKASSLFENKLYRNDGGHFTNVTTQAGITSNIFTFSLGISTADINMDGWPDVYVTNDFEEIDYMYINQHDGTFIDSLQQKIDHASLFAMGVDVADYNNDQLPDVVVLDMLPEGNLAQKMHMGNDNFNRYQYQFSNGMYYQYMKNTLQKNNGDGTYSEIGQLAGVAATDWSWTPLFADYDNDGLKDLFITNGYQRDNTDMQFMGYAMNQSIHDKKREKLPAAQDYISQMPGISIPNYIFRNKGNNQFENKIKDWGFDHNTFSHGAAYADLDNDGYLDLITNNTGGEAGIYKNNGATQLKNNFLKIKLQGPAKNFTGIGAKVFAFAKGGKFYLEQLAVRGYQSSSNQELVLGLGEIKSLDSIIIVWPDDKRQLIKGVKANTNITVVYEQASSFVDKKINSHKLLTESSIIDFTHIENVENDFTKQFLLPHFFSHNGPCLAQGDVNGDGRVDVFAGGAKGQPGAIFLQSKNNTFLKMKSSALDNDAASEDVDAVFFDADGDKDLDLYVVSGGYEFPENSPFLQDRLYLNNGKGDFTKSEHSLYPDLTNKKCVRPIDFDNDGDLDLFIGGNVIQGKYPLASSSKIYFNNGKGNFSIIRPANAPLGIVNDAMWIDLNGDGRKDLIVAGEWLSLKAYLSEGKLFKDVSKQWFPFACNGWWNCIASGDFDKDGDIDLVVGNFGLNSPLKADEQHPMQLYYGDLDGNGSIEPIITHYIGDESVPLFMRDDMISQLPLLKKKFNDYGEYAKASIHEILTVEQLKALPVLQTNTLATIYLENTGKGFIKRDLPLEVQESPVYAVVTADINGDGNVDLVLAGNNIYNRIYISKIDANHGIVLLGDGKGHFKYSPQNESGLNVKGDVRSMLVHDSDILFGINDRSLKSYSFKK